MVFSLVQITLLALLELLFIVVIIALLAALAIPIALNARKKSIRDAEIAFNETGKSLIFSFNDWALQPPPILDTETDIEFRVATNGGPIAGVVLQKNIKVTFVLISTAGGSAPNAALFKNGSRTVTTVTDSNGIETATLKNIGEGQEMVLVYITVNRSAIPGTASVTFPPNYPDIIDLPYASRQFEVVPPP